MKIEVDKNQTSLMYSLKINDEEILTDHDLGIIVDKIEQYLKMRFLKEVKGQNKLFGFFK